MILSPLREAGSIDGRTGKPPFPAAATTALHSGQASHRKERETKTSAGGKQRRGNDPELAEAGGEVGEGRPDPGHGARDTMVTELEEEEVLSDAGNE